MTYGGIASYRHVQAIALKALHGIQPFIREGVTEADIARECTRLMAQEGIDEWWYHRLPSLVLVGSHTPLSVSGRDYRATEVRMRASDLVTIDLGPVYQGCWGDCARSYAVGNGMVTLTPEDPALAEGLNAEKRLHEAMQSFAAPHVTMHELFLAMDADIAALGYENLDFKGNLGHSIEKHIDARHYIEEGNATRLGDVLLFTFEPHIRKKGGAWGFKRENIYYFENARLVPPGSAQLL